MTKKKVLDAMLRAFKAKTPEEVEKIALTLDDDLGGAAAEGKEGSTHVHVHLPGQDKDAQEKTEEGQDAENEGAEGKQSYEEKMMDLMTKIHDKLCATSDEGSSEEKEEGKEGAEDAEAEEETGKEKTKDTAARLEILAPGSKLPTQDAKKPDAKKFADAMCACKRKALDTAAKGDHAELLKPLLASVDVAKARRATVDAMFTAASEMVKNKNNAAGQRGAVKTTDFGKPHSIEAMNAKNNDFWAKQGVKS